MSKPPIDASKLRLAAEARLAVTMAEKPTNGHAIDQARLVHELQIHEIEMEMQSETLRQTHAALEESHKRYLDLYERAPVGYLTLNREGHIIEINQTGAALFEMDRASLIKRNFSALIAFEETGHWLDFFKNLIDSGGHENAEFRIARKNAIPVYIRIDCLRVHKQDHELAVHVAITDITARKFTEARLREQEELFRLITERLDGFIAVLDLEGRRVYNSPSYERLLGKRNIAGTDAFMEIHPDDRDFVIQAFRETVVSGIGQHLEYRFLMPDNGIRVMESRGGLIWDEKGQTKYVVVVSNDITERKEAEEKIRRLAFHDALTELPNRLTLNDRLQQAMAASKRSGQYGALLFLDLDNFKALNDTHGHAMGDRLLVQTAQRITDCVREIDTVARFGGDEFVIVLGELDVDLEKSVADTKIIAEKIRAAIAEPYTFANTTHDKSSPCITHSCTASIGVVLFLNHDQSEEEVLKLADIAMYRAKNDGRDNIYFHGMDC